MKLMELLKGKEAASCAECGVNNTTLHKHHDDYAKMDETRLLCPACHVAWHTANGHAANHHLAPHLKPAKQIVGERMMNSAAAAAAMGISAATICRWRADGYGPKYMRLGPRTIRYLIDDVEEWLRRAE